MAKWFADIKQQSWGRDGGSFTGGPPKGVLHTTESASWPGYDAGGTAPHFTAMPVVAVRRLDFRQHTPLDRAARALMNHDGGVQTNRDTAIQIELVGTCDPARHRKSPSWCYWPSAPAWAIEQLAAFMRRIEQQCGVARSAVTPFLPYPNSYGSARGQRLSLSQWDNFSGWAGHQNVPENDHGDPGDIDIRLLIGTIDTRPKTTIPPVKPPHTSGTPAFPLAKGYYFGPKDGGAQSTSGYFGANARAGLRAWQERARKHAGGATLGVDGLYGSHTATVARLIQQRAALDTDGLIGPATWSATWVTS